MTWRGGRLVRRGEREPAARDFGDSARGPGELDFSARVISNVPLRPTHERFRGLVGPAPHDRFGDDPDGRLAGSLGSARLVSRLANLRTDPKCNSVLLRVATSTAPCRCHAACWRSRASRNARPGPGPGAGDRHDRSIASKTIAGRGWWANESMGTVQPNDRDWASEFPAAQTAVPRSSPLARKTYGCAAAPVLRVAISVSAQPEASLVGTKRLGIR